MPNFKIEDLESKCCAVLEGAGVSAEEAERIVHSLVLSNMMGYDSHGVIRIEQYVNALEKDYVRKDQTIKIVKESDASAVVDGGWGFGQSICRQAMMLAMEKAGKRSVGAIELFHCSHIGRLGEWVEMAAEENMIGIVMCNNHGSGSLQAPYGGIEPRMSPNPVAVGIPTGGEFPIVMDMTTSVAAEGKIRVARNRGEALPEGWILNAEGQPSTDPVEFYGPPRGAILPFGGITAHKGYALAIVVDILSGALGGAGCSRPGPTRLGANGVFMLVIDIGAFISIEDFKKETQNFMAWLKSSKLMEGFDEILVPGEMESRQRKRKKEEGVFIDEESWRQICETGKRMGVYL